MKAIPAPGFAGDSGAADPAVLAALREYAAGGLTPQVIQALLSARLLVPVVAVAGVTPGSDSGSEMAAVMLQGADGRRAQLAFSSVSTMRSWDPTARPVPLPAWQVARAALEQGAEALMVDPSQSRVVLGADVLRHAAAGHQLVRDGAGFAWAIPVRAEYAGDE